LIYSTRTLFEADPGETRGILSRTGAEGMTNGW
jgi:hypothetical protein